MFILYASNLHHNSVLKLSNHYKSIPSKLRNLNAATNTHQLICAPSAY